MKRNLVIASALALCLCLTAGAALDEKPQKIVSPIKEKHDGDWYVRQSRLWKEVIKKSPTDEEAWGNYYRAIRYSLWYVDNPQQEESRLDSVMTEMERAIPNTYTLYLTHFYHRGDLKYANEMRKAMTMQPDNVDEYSVYAGFLMQSCDEKGQEALFKRWYASGTYSSSLLNYAYNEMASLPANAILISNGDAPCFSQLMLQYGKGLFGGVQQVCAGMLYSPDYSKAMAKKLGIPPFETIEGFSSMNSKEVFDAMLMHIIHHTKRPIYLSSTCTMPSFTDKLYNEGLVVKYSEQPYDNLKVKRHNYENVYLLDYLKQSFSPESYQGSVTPLNLNYIPCLKSLLDYYKTSGDQTHYTALHDLMMQIVKNETDLTQEKRDEYKAEIER